MKKMFDLIVLAMLVVVVNASFVVGEEDPPNTDTPVVKQEAPKTETPLPKSRPITKEDIETAPVITTKVVPNAKSKPITAADLKDDGKPTVTAVVESPAKKTVKITPVVKIPEFKLTPFDKELLKQINARRAGYNLAPLTMDVSVMKTARAHCYWMAANYNMSHGSYNVAENIAWNQSSVSEVMQSWMNSSGHRANILGNYTRVGVSCYDSVGGGLYWCQQFK